MIVAAALVSVGVFVTVGAGLLLGGASQVVAGCLAWAVACLAFLLVCLVGYGAELSGEWRER